MNVGNLDSKLNPDGDPKITLKDLIAAYTLQKLMTDATLDALREAENMQRELTFYRERAIAQLNRQLEKQGDDNADI